MLFNMITGTQAILHSEFYKILNDFEITYHEAYCEYEDVKPFIQQLIFLNTEAGYKEYAQKSFKA